MRVLRLLLGYALLVFVGGAAAAPWLYQAVRRAGAHWTWLASVAAMPFPRYLNRAILGLAVIGLIWFSRAARLNSLAALGLKWREDSGWRLAHGFLLGWVSLACVAAVGIASGAREIDSSAGPVHLLATFARAGGAALVVGSIEEIVFRGAVFGALRQSLPVAAAVLISSLAYAGSHFLERPHWPEGPVGAGSGFAVLAAMAGGFSDLHKVFPGLLNLTVAGAILAWAYARTGSLYFPIGLHAGWIFWLKWYGALTSSGPGASAWIWGTRKLIDGWFALAGLVLAAAAVGWSVRPGRAPVAGAPPQEAE